MWPNRQKVCHSTDNVNNYLVDNNRCVQPMQIDVCEHIRTRYRSINYNYLCCRCPGNITFLAVLCNMYKWYTCTYHRRRIRIEQFLRVEWKLSREIRRYVSRFFFKHNNNTEEKTRYNKSLLLFSFSSFSLFAAFELIWKCCINRC